MKPDLPKHFWKIIVVLLSIVCLLQSAVLLKFYDNRQPSNSFLDSFDTYSSHLNQKFKNQTKDNFDLFDRFFNDDFFSNNTDPFKELDRLSRELEKRMSGTNSHRLKNYSDEWAGKRFSKSDHNITVEMKEKKELMLMDALKNKGFIVMIKTKNSLLKQRNIKNNITVLTQKI